MRAPSLILAILAILLPVNLASAQQALEWIPQGVEALRQEASSKTEFTLDHSMLIFAAKLDPDDQDLLRVIAGVSGLSVHSYRFSAPWIYDPEALSSVKTEYHAAGWKQVMSNHPKDGGPGLTDIWIRWQNKAVSNVAILVASAREVNLIEVSGSISPLDLLRLGGHFGIPKIEGGVVVRDDGRRP